jgi:hypothetical protein
MQKSRVLILLIVVAGLSAAGTTWISAQQQRRQGSHVLLSPEDYIEIHQLYSFYTRDVDPGSKRNAAWMFAEDGVAQLGNRRYTGQELKDFYAQLPKNQSTGVRHINSSYVIVGTPEGARGSSYMIQVERRGEGKPVEVTLFGKYEDRFVKTRDGWRFKERIWTPDTFRGSDQVVSSSPIPGDE